MAYFNLITHDWGTFVIRNYYNDFIPSSGRVTIGNNVVFGRNVTVLKGVTIGDNCIIGTGAIVTKDIPDKSVAVGVPARSHKYA
jgi:acetyltransferase-like isoleucine patch superfamily enzyme